MKSIQIIRPVNGFIVLLTFMVVRFILNGYFESTGLMFKIKMLDYCLMIIAGMLILSAGNVINDIIDRDIDRVNKPDKVLIPNIISVNKAYQIYGELNLFALIISVFLAFKYQKPLYLLFPVLTIVLLYIYSRFLKKTFLVGNLTIAGLCAILPVVGFVVEWDAISVLKNNYPSIYFLILFKLISMVVFSLIQVLNRELVKDCEDVYGDQVAGAHTIPIKLGIQKANNLIGIYMGLFIIVFIALGLVYLKLKPEWKAGVVMLCFTVIYLASFVYYYFRKRTSSTYYKYLSRLIKVHLLLGLIFVMI